MEPVRRKDTKVNYLDLLTELYFDYVEYLTDTFDFLFFGGEAYEEDSRDKKESGKDKESE